MSFATPSAIAEPQPPALPKRTNTSIGSPDGNIVTVVNILPQLERLAMVKPGATDGLSCFGVIFIYLFAKFWVIIPQC
jgi:hypothetical protein